MGYNRCRFARIYTVLGVLNCQLMGYNRCRFARIYTVLGVLSCQLMGYYPL